MSIFLPKIPVAQQILHCGIRTAVVVGCFYSKASPKEAHYLGATLLVDSVSCAIASSIIHKNSPELEKKIYKIEHPNWSHRIRTIGKIALFSDSISSLTDAFFWTAVASVGPCKMPLPLLIICQAAINSRSTYLANGTFPNTRKLTENKFKKEFKESLSYSLLNKEDFSNDSERRELIALKDRCTLWESNYFMNSIKFFGAIIVGRVSLIAANHIASRPRV